MMPTESVERGLAALKDGIRRSDEAHTSALFVAALNLLGGEKPTRSALAHWAAEHPDSWPVLASLLAFGSPLRPVARIPRPVQRFCVTYNMARMTMRLDELAG
jgi:hypothetical protein